MARVSGTLPSTVFPQPGQTWIVVAVRSVPVFAASSAFDAETVMDFLYGKSVSDGERCRLHVLGLCLRKELGCIFFHSYPSLAMASSEGSFILACKAVGVRYADRFARRAAIRRTDRPQGLR